MAAIRSNLKGKRIEPAALNTPLPLALGGCFDLASSSSSSSSSSTPTVPWIIAGVGEARAIKKENLLINGNGIYKDGIPLANTVHVPLSSLALGETVGHSEKATVMKAKIRGNDNSRTYALKFYQRPDLSVVDYEIKQLLIPLSENSHVVRIFNAYFYNDTFFVLMEFVDLGNLKRLIDLVESPEEGLRSGPVNPPDQAPALLDITPALSDTAMEVDEQLPVSDAESTNEQVSDPDGHVFISRQHLPANVVACITRQVLKGLQRMHSRGLAHRDIEPRNILLNHSGNVKIADFGWVQSVDTKWEPTRGVGTPSYCSPESFDGSSRSFHTDIWSLGVTVAHLALGAFPLLTLADLEIANQRRQDTTKLDQCLNHINLDIRIQDRSAFVDFPFMIQQVFRCSGVQPDITPELQDFVTLCTKPNYTDRPSCDVLLRHAFIANCTMDQDGLKQWLKEKNIKNRLNPPTRQFGWLCCR